MTQIAIISGVYGSGPTDFVRSVPVNLVPVAEPGDGSGSGISKGYLRLEYGVRTMAAIAGRDRGGYLWQGQHLRVIGSKLVRVDMAGAQQVLGDVGDDDKGVTFAEGFGRIGIASNHQLFYYDGSTLTPVTDPDLGDVLSLAWSDGYFITTDGTSIVVTQLNDPTAVDPLKYGSSEADPDSVVGVLALRGEVYAINRYTIEKFVNGGGSGFPYARSRGSQIPKGCVGAQAFTPFVETFAFCGSARNETASIYLAGSGQGIRISPRVLDIALANLSDSDLSQVVLESLNANGLYRLLVHLPDETWIYHWSASQLLDSPVWSRAAGGVDLSQPFPVRHFTMVGDQWWCAGSGKLGAVDATLATLLDDPIAFSFDTPVIYNGGAGAIVNELELVPLNKMGGPASQVALSYTDDGVSWSQDKFAQTGGGSQRTAWRRLGRLRHWCGFRFRGVANAPLSFARLEAQLEPMNG